MLKKTYKIGICDDMEYWRQEIAGVCNKKCKEHDIQVEYLFFSTGKELLQSGKELDLLFLDEEMPEVSGLEVKEAFEEYNSNTVIIFVTNHEEILHDSFGKNVYGFLRKPINYMVFSKLFDKLLNKLDRRSYIQFFDSINGHQYIPCSNILYIFAEGSYSKIVMNKGNSVTIRKGIGELDNEITYKYLVRIHKSYIVNLMQSCTLDYDASIFSIDSDPPVIIHVARRRKKELQKLYMDMILEKANIIWNI